MNASTLHIMDNIEIFQERNKELGNPKFLKNRKRSCFTNKKLKADKEQLKNKQTATYSLSPEGTVMMYGVLSNIVEKLSNVSFPLSTQNSEGGDNELPEDAKELSVDLGCDITELLDDPLKIDDKEKIEEFISVHEQYTKEHAEKILPVTAKSHTGSKKASPLVRHTSYIHQAVDFQQASTVSEALTRGQQSNTLGLRIDSQVSDGSSHLLRDGQKSIVPLATNPQIRFGSTLVGKDEYDSLDSSIITQAESSQQVGTSHSKKSTEGAKNSGKKTAGRGDSTENKKTKNTKQQKENKSASPGVSTDISLPGSGDAGDGRRDDDGQGGDDDGKKKYKYTTYVVKTEEEEEMEEEEKKMDETDHDDEIVPEPLNIMQCLKVAFQNRADLRNCLRPCPTRSSRSGDYYLQHLQQCSLGHVACEESHQVVCEECRQYLSSLEELMSITGEEEALFLFPFFEEYIKANTQEERHLVIFLWLYERAPGKSIKAKVCRKKLKRIRLSTSQGARPKKKFRFGSSKPVDTEPTPSPGDSPGELLFGQNAIPCQRPSVVQGTREQLQRKLKNWNRNEVDEVNDGVLLSNNLTPQNGCYRPDREFRLFNCLGTGSFGDVYLATDNITTNEFVCKVVIKERIEINEVLIWMQLDHPRIVPLCGVVRNDSHFYMFSKYFRSQTLACGFGGRFSERNVEYTKVMKQILEGTEYIHSLNIIHMDIKPENILYTHEGNISIIDWGLALKLNGKDKQQLGSLRGTEDYAAPEVIACKPFDETCDIWSVMCSMLHIICGRAELKRFRKLRTFQYVPPSIEDMPANINPVIRTFLIEGFGCEGYRPSATELLKNPIFFMEEFLVQEENMQIQVACPPPDGLSEDCIRESMTEAEDSLSSTMNTLQLAVGGASGVDQNEVKPSSIERLLQLLQLNSTSEEDRTRDH